MATENLATLKKTQFFGGEKERKERRAKKQCPYKIKRVWDAKKQKYVKTKVYRKRTTFTRAEMKEHFNTKHVDIVICKTITTNQNHMVHAKVAEVAKTLPIGFNMRGQRYEWDSEATGVIRYKLVS